MGRPSSSQPKHSVLDVEPVKHTSLQQTRSKGGIRQCDSIPPSAPPAIDEPTPHRHLSPSPLITSLSSEKYFDAHEEFPPLSSPIVTGDEDEGEDEDDSEDIFHDALESLGRPILANVHQVIPSPQYDGAAKGRAGVQPRNRPLASTPAASPSTPAPSFDLLKFGFPSNAERGSAKPAATPTGRPSVTPAAAQARNAVPWCSLPLFRPPVKKALVVGINYKDLPEDKRLYYAVRDAKLWHKTLIGRGVSDENIRTITDELPEGEAPTCEVLVEQIRWLVQGAKAGDSLFFVYSGHAVPTQFGPSIVTADHRKLFRPVLERELVMPVPAGVDLQVVFDCCHSAGMISLQYCVGRMDKEAPSSDSPTEAPMDCSSDFEPSESLAPIPEAAPVRSSSPYPNAPQHGSLYGIPAADTAIPRHPPVPPAVLNQDTFSPQPTRHSHVRGGTVVAAQPLTGTTNATPAAGNPLVAAASYMASFMGIGSAPAASTAPAPAPGSSVQIPASSESSPAAARLPTTSGPRRACQGVVEGTRIPDYFAERTEGYVRTAGKVMVWAGTGERQKAFETYGRARHGVVTKALCAALEQVGTRRDMWSYLVQEIEAENDKRWKRDATKAINEQPMRSTRIQHAELWVSQGHSFGPLRSAAPALDQPIL